MTQRRQPSLPQPLDHSFFFLLLLLLFVGLVDDLSTTPLLPSSFNLSSTSLTSCDLALPSTISFHPSHLISVTATHGTHLPSPSISTTSTPTTPPTRNKRNQKRKPFRQLIPATHPAVLSSTYQWSSNLPSNQRFRDRWSRLDGGTVQAVRAARVDLWVEYIDSTPPPCKSTSPLCCSQLSTHEDSNGVLLLR